MTRHFLDRKQIYKQWLIPGAIFLVAVVVRLPALGQFITVDEPKWIERSRWFTVGLLFPAQECPPVEWGRPFAAQGLGCTLQIGYPGVTTMWGGSVGLLAYYWWTAAPADVDLRHFLLNLTPEKADPGLIAATRRPLAISAAVFVVIFYGLVRRLTSERLALVAALLIALNPFHIALSRVLHHDALTTMMMTISLLAALGYWLHGWSGRWLVISAVAAGLALSTKSVGWFMPPYIALVGLGSLYGRRRSLTRSGWPGAAARLVGEGLGWGLVAGLAFFAFFPAMWVTPKQVFQVMFEANTRLAAQGHGHYFLGRITNDPGLLFYPLNWLLRTSPLELLGLLMIPVALWQTQRRGGWSALKEAVMSRPLWIALALFVGFLLIFETATPKKMLRYFLPAFPVIALFTASGLVWLAERLVERYHRLQGLGLPLLSGLIVLVQGWFVAGHYPYYFTYYNPLLGGPAGAARLTTILGWGEGMNEAAAYLNRQPAANSLRVALNPLGETLVPFFKGEADFSREPAKILKTDYVVYYRPELQRNIQKNMDVWQYLSRHHSPVHRVTWHGLDYVLIYRNPIQTYLPPGANSLPRTYTIGYNLAEDGELRLFWQNQGVAEEIWAGLAPSAGGETRWTPCRAGPGFAAEARTLGAIVESVCFLPAAEAPPGLYDLRLGLGPGEAIASIPFPAGRLALAIDGSGRYTRPDPAQALERLAKQELPAQVRPLSITFGDFIEMIGYQWEPVSLRPNGQNSLTLYWQAAQEVTMSDFAEALQISLRLIPAQNDDPTPLLQQRVMTAEMQGQGLPPGGITPTTYSFTLPDDLAAGDYTIEVCLTDMISGQLVVGFQENGAGSLECVSLPAIIGQ